MIEPISSRSNPILQKIKHVRDRKDTTMIFCEGDKLIEELFKSSITPTWIGCTKKTETVARALINTYKKNHLVPVILTPDIMAHVSDLETPPGLIALAKRPDEPKEKNDKNLLLVIHEVQNPQNAGALLRTAEATGVSQIWFTEKSADPYSPKVLRGSMGNTFRLFIKTAVKLEDVFSWMNENGVVTVAATQTGKKRYDAYNWKQPTALLVGSEGHGFSAETLAHVKETIHIPMKGKVESLNVGVATAVCLFEAMRQKENAL